MASMISKQKNIERLIARCENILSGKAQFQGKEWKLAKVSKLRPVSCISGNSSTRPPAHLPNFTPSHMHTLTHAHSMWLLLMIRSKNWRSIQGLSFSKWKKFLGQLKIRT